VKGAGYCHGCGKQVGAAKVEQLTLDSDEVVAKVKELLHEGNVTRIIVKDEKGNLLLDLPVTIGVVGIVLAPLLAAAGAIAAVATRCTLTIERKA
jgi:CBS domain-containing protein